MVDGKNQIQYQDVRNVMDGLGWGKELTESEKKEVINNIMKKYPRAQEEDRGGTWNLVVEQLLQDEMS